jgi:hypothetical protein
MAPGNTLTLTAIAAHLCLQVHHRTPYFIIKIRAATTMHCRLLAASILLLLVIGALGGTTKSLRSAEGHATAAASRQILQKQGPVRNSECLPSRVNEIYGQWTTWVGPPDKKTEMLCTGTKYPVHYCCTGVTRTHFTGCEKADYSWKEPSCWPRFGPDGKSKVEVVHACCTK